MTEKFDVIVVGAGPAGNAAAYTAAKAGLSVLQIERGEYAGSKNVQGAILYADALERMIPGFRDDAPLERHIVEQRMWVLDDEGFVGTHQRSAHADRPPHNRYTIIRAAFDQWFSRQVRDAGALVICETTVEELLLDGKTVRGVRCDRAGGEVLADVVILADGVNSVLARKAGLRPEIAPGNVALAVKELLFLPEEVIRQRFAVDENQGVVVELLGSVTEGMVGTGFLYTNKESIALGVGCMLSDFKANPKRTTPYALLDKLKRHPAIAPLIEGGEMKEYAAHLIPEGGYDAIPQMHGDGWMIAGDSAGLVNAVHREGSNLAMTSGRLAAETAVAAKAAGRFDAKTLAAYRAALEDSFVMKDLRKYRRVPGLLHENRQFVDGWPQLVNGAARTMLTVDGVPKADKQREIFAGVRAARGVRGLVADAFNLWRAFK